MRNIWTVFKTDIKSLSRCFFAMAVAVAITVLPSLYAWLNIYSNWDPYGNTGNISIGLYSGDEGCIEDGEFVNMGQDVVDNLREATTINWVVCDSAQQAIDGVYSGEYYASVVIDADFSYKMFNMLTKWTGKPSLTYYENAKKNAVATKITDTAVDSVRRTVSEAYLEVVVNAIMKQGNQIAHDLKDDENVTLATVLDDAKTTINSCVRTIDNFAAASNGGSSSSGSPIDASQIEAIMDAIGGSGPSITEISVQIYNACTKALQAIKDFNDFISGMNPGLNFQVGAADAANMMKQTAEQLNALAAALNTAHADQTSINVVEDTADLCSALEVYLNQLADGGASVDVGKMNALLDELMEHTAQLVPTAQALQEDIGAILGQVNDTLIEIRGLSDSAAQLAQAIEATRSSLEDTLDIARPLMQSAGTNIANKLRALDTIDPQDYIDALVDILGANPEVYSEYFSEMVQTSVNKVYTIDNYGSAMAPFYSVLAIWVGCVILAAILKPHARTDGLIDPKPAELFFGRYLLFFIMNQLQALIIIAGDLYILKIQCVHPGLLYLTGFFTSLTFSLLIYALAYSFGDVGKAVVVIVMVLQIAGSSGTFPVELLPEFNRRIYILFPFPYAIDMMRECICGLYGMHYVQKLGLLLIFAVVGLVIGLLVSQPFSGLNHFMEEKLEETELF